MLGLLADISTASWNSLQKQLDPEHLTSQPCSSISSHIYLYTVTPEPVSPEAVSAVLDFLIKIKPNSQLKRGLNTVLDTPGLIKSSSEKRKLLALIDKSIESLLQYFSASNWSDVYPKIQEILKKVQSSKTEYTEPVLGVEIIATLYLDAPKANTLMKDVISTVPHLKKSGHKHTLGYFLQKTLSYWMHARPQEFAFESQNDTPLSQTATILFDCFYSSSEETSRPLATWNLLGLLISFMPQAFQDDEVAIFTPSKTKYKVRSTFKRHSSKKLTFLSAINSIMDSHQEEVDSIVLSATNHIIKCGSILAIFAPSSPIVTYASGLYPFLMGELFAPPSHSSGVVSLHHFQAAFVTSFAVLNPKDLVKDVFPIVNASNEFLTFIPNILQGFINLRQLKIFIDHFYSLMDQVYPMLRQTMRDTYLLLRDFPKERRSSKLYEDYTATLSNCFSIFTADPHYVIKLHEYNPVYQEDNLFLAVVFSTLSTDETIQKLALQFCWSFIEPSNLEKFRTEDMASNPNNPAFPSFMQFGQLAQILGQNILELETIDASIIKYLELIKGLLIGRCNLIQLYKFDEICERDPTKIEPREYRQSISSTLEMTMYMCLCSIDTQVCKLAFEIMNCLVQEAVVIEDLTNPSDSAWSILPNFAMHSEFSSSAYLLTGTVAVQKRLYQFLQHLQITTPTVISTWKLVSLKLRGLTQEILDATSLDRAKIKQWRSYCGFLCSALSPSLVGDGEKHVEGNLSKTSEDFLTEMIGFLTLTKSPFLRETARDILSRDTNHLSYHFIFKTIEHEILTRISRSNNSLGEQDFLLLEQCVMLLRSVIGVINDGDLYLSADIGALALTIVKCLNSIPAEERAVRLRVQYCHLFEIIAGHKDTINMKHDISIRNEITTIFASWLDKCLSARFTDDTESMLSGSTSNRSYRRREIEYERLQKECICAVVQAFTVILLDLRLDPPDSVHEKDIVDVKAQKFGSLFTIFLRILEKCRAEESGSNTGSLVLGDRLAVVKSNTIECASKLLNANMDVGLKFALPLGLQDDPFIRVSFIKILDNILAHGAKNAKEETEVQRYQELADFVTSNINITLSLCDVCPATEVDDFANALLNIFDSKGSCLNLVKAVVTREVEKAETPMEILRRNCVATKVLSIYAHMKGFSYLKVVLYPFLNDLITSPELYLFETNPDKIPSGQSVDSNYKKFDRSIKKLVGVLQRTVNDIPPSLRDVCNTIASSAGPKFPTSKDSSVTAVSAFFLLRFICPALVSPEGVGLLETAPPKDVRRTLLILAKMIQNMAYGSTSFVKLSIFKRHTANYISDSEIVIKILRSISEPSPDFDDDSSQASLNVRQVDQSHTEVLHRFLYHHWEDINHKMIMDQRIRLVNQNEQRGSEPSANSSESEDKDLRASHKLTSMIRNLGRPRSLNSNKQPVAPPPETTSNIQTTPRLREFLTRNAHRDMGPIIERRIVSEGMDKDGTPLLLVTCRNYNKDEVDTELVLCRYFQVASKMWNQPFGIFYDVTGYSSTNLFPVSARSIAEMMIPEEMVKNCIGIYFCNVSTDFLSPLKSMIKHHYSGIFLNPMRVHHEFLTSAEIVKKFNISTLNLDPWTIRVINDVRIIFNNVYRYNHARKDMKQVTIKLGNEYIQIRSQEPFNYVKTSPGFSNDIFSLRDISDVYKSHTNGHPDEFTIELLKPAHKKITLHCSKGYEIVRAILNAKTRLPRESQTNSFVMSPETSIAALANIALSGLCSEFPPTQEASYNLMASIQHRFDLDLHMKLHGGKGLRLPANVFGRVKMFSTAIAQARPDITVDMLNHMFTAFQATSADRRQGVLMYAIPWVKNIVAHVLDDSEENQNAIAQIIRKFLDISIDGNRDYMFLLQSVWPIILEENKLIPIVLNEILFLLIDNGIYSGSQLDDTVSILTSMPSVEVCKVVMLRVREMALSSGTISGVSLAQHPKWSEFVILITILSAILFENPKVVEGFFPELSLCVVIFLHTGTYSFRKTLYNMTVNMMHAFMYSDSCDAERRKHVETLWKDLTSKGNMIFGISEEMKYVEYDYPVTSLMFQIESCCTVLNDLAATVTSSTKNLENRHSFIEKCLEMGTQRFSVLQCRAILALGCTARVDVEDSTVSEVLAVLYDGLVSTNDNAARDELLLCIAFSISKISDGLRLDSKYLPRLFWLAVALMGTCNMKIFGYALQLLQTTLKNLDEYGAFKNSTIASYLLACRNEFKAEWNQFEQLTNINFTEQYFEVDLTATLLRGLEKSTTRAATLATFEVLLSVFARNSSHIRDRDTLDSSSLGGRANSISSIGKWSSTVAGASRLATGVEDEVVTMSSESLHYVANGKIFPSFFPFLFVLYLGSRSTAELKDYLWLAGYAEDQVDDDIPTQIKAFITSEKTVSLLCMYLCVQIFRVCENEEVMECRVLSCLQHLGSVNSDKFFKVYFVARGKIRRILDNGPSTAVLKAALDAAKCALCHLSDLQRKAFYISEMDTILTRVGLTGISHAGGYSSSNASLVSVRDHFSELAAVVKRLIARQIISEGQAQTIPEGFVF